MLQFVDLLYWKPLYEAESIHNNQWTMTIVKEKVEFIKVVLMPILLTGMLLGCYLRTVEYNY